MAANSSPGVFNGASAPTAIQNSVINGSQPFPLSDSSQARTLYVGNLDPQANEGFLLTLFNQIGEVTNFKIIHEPGNDPYCFVEFLDHSIAASALLTMNKRQCLGRELKVNWATSATNAPKQDTSKHYHIFVGDLSTDLDTPQLRDAFMPFGEISDCRVVRDLQTLKSKGYGFVSFVKKADAENAIATMNGQWLGTRAIRTNWATRKPPAARTGNGDSHNSLQNSMNSGQLGPHILPQSSGSHHGKQLSYEDVYNQTGPLNCTVYCGGLPHGLTEELIQKTFYQFGPIQEIRVFKDKGYAFIKFMSKEAAANAICTIHNTDINGQTVKCSWGKESVDPNGQAAAAAVAAAGGMAASTQYAYPYQYWYPQGYASHPMAAQAFAAGQFAAVPPAAMASMQAAYNPYGQYYAASTPGSFNPLMTWQAAALPSPAAAAAQSGSGSGNLASVNAQQASHNQQQQNSAQQQPIIGAYPMQSYQAQ